MTSTVTKLKNIKRPEAIMRVATSLANEKLNDDAWHKFQLSLNKAAVHNLIWQEEALEDSRISNAEDYEETTHAAVLACLIAHARSTSTGNFNC